MANHSYSPPAKYRWLILILLALINFTFNASQFQVAGLAHRLIPDFGLTSSQYASVLSAPMLSAVFLCIAGGTLGDRFGPKNVLVVGLVIGTAALFLRTMAANYWQLLGSMLLFGIMMALSGANSSKLIGIWFPKKQMGLAFSIFFFITMAGNTVSLAVTSFFPSTFAAFLTSACLMLVLTVLWIFLGKNTPPGTALPPAMPMKEYLQVAARSKNVWLGGWLALLYMGATMSFVGFFATGLNSVQGVSPAAAGFMASIYTLGNMLGGFIGPILVERGGSFKWNIIILALSGGIFTYLSWIIPYGPLMVIFLLLGGTLTGCIIPNLITLPLRLPEIGPVYAGSAGGIINTLQLSGAFCIPTFVFGAIAGQNYHLIFILASVTFLLIAPFAALLPHLKGRGE